MTASTSSTLRPTTAGTLVAGFPRGRFYASPGTRVLSFSRASSTTLPADALRGPGPLGAREGAGDVAAGRIERSARPLPVAGAGLDQAAQRLVCGAAPRAVLDGHLIARQADRAVDVADGTGPASSRTPYPTAEQAGPQVLRAPVAAALSSPPPDPLPGLAAALRGLTHEAARFPQLIIIYDQIPDRRRGRGFATGIHLNEALEWSKRPGPPHTMNALTVRQPWASAIISGRKRVENRRWSTRVRGRIAIHSSQKPEGDWRRLAAMLEDAATWNTCRESPNGTVLGRVELVDCVEESDDYLFDGRPYYGFVMANPRPLRKPIHVRGSQRFWTVPPNIARRLR